MEEVLPEKFGSVSDLVTAYKALESEFTKRNNELKALRAENDRLKEKPTNETAENAFKTAYSPPLPQQTEENGSDIKVFSGGQAVRTLPFKPKTLAEANALAQQFLKGE